MQLVPGGLAEGVPEDKTPPPAPIPREIPQKEAFRKGTKKMIDW